MSSSKSKAQGLVEFALILPILLILLLGIFEIGRVIWAYITVQAAARDAARYAVTGKPYITNPLQDFSDNPACSTIDGEADATKPWRCSPESRAEAIKKLAIERGNALIGNSTTPPFCIGGPDDPGGCVCDYPKTPKYGYDPSWNCENTPNAFGVQVVGQTTDVVGRPLPRGHYAGDQGLNVVVYTFYNVKMVTPIFDLIAGGLPITVRGEVQMQNEGQNEAFTNNGGVAPISIRPPITGPGTKNSCVAPAICGPKGQAIKSGEGYGPFALGKETILIQLIDHDQSQVYDIYLQNIDDAADTTPIRICQNVLTDGDNFAEETCNLSGITKAGTYCLFSASAGVAGQTCKNPLAKADQDVTIGDGNSSTDSSILVRDSDGESKVNDKVIWARHSPVYAVLQNYEPGTYDVYVVMPGGAGEMKLNTVPVVVDDNGFASSEPAQRLLPLTDESAIPAAPCPPTGTTPCLVETRSTDGVISNTQIYVTQPAIKFLGGTTYQKGETIPLQLANHTPNRTYWVVVFTNTQIFAKQKVTVDEEGNSNLVSISLNDNILDNKTIVWDNGLYYVRTYPDSNTITEAVLETTWVAPKQGFEVDTTNSCYLTIEGVSKENYRFPIGTLLNIQLHKHPEDTYFLQFGNSQYGYSRIPTNRANNTVPVDASGEQTQAFIIPLTTTTTNTATKYIISSFSNNVTQDPAPINDACASIEIMVLPKPYIMVFENGKRMDDPDADMLLISTYPPVTQAVLPDADITVSLRNHAANGVYQLFYAGNEMKFNRVIQVDSNGSLDVVYDLVNLPKTPGLDITDSKNWGKPLPMYSLQNSVRIATTTLTIRSADLWAREAAPAPTQVVHTSGAPKINRPYTVTFTIQNTSTIAISRYFDIDLYKNPVPVAPGQIERSFNLPGDFKQWRTTPLASQQTFQVQQAFTLTHYGVQTFYAYANTSRFVSEVTESNNVVSTTVNLSCGEAPLSITPETFGVGSQVEVAGPEINFNAPYELKGGSGGVNDSEWRGVKQQNNGGTYRTSQNQLILVHGAGRPDASGGHDRVYALYYNQPITRLASSQITIVSAPNGNGLAYGDVSGTTTQGWAGLEVRTGSLDITRNTDKRFYLALKWSKLSQNYTLVAGGRIAANNNQVPEVALASPKLTKSQLPITLKIFVDKDQKLQFYYGINGAPPVIPIASFASALNGITFTPEEAQSLYTTFFASNGDDNQDYYSAGKTSETVFDDLKTTMWSEGGKFAGTNWEAQPYGGKTADPTLGTGTAALVLKNTGGDNIGSRNDNNNGYFFYRYKNPTAISTKFDFEAILGIRSLSGSGQKAMAGLEIRREVDASSAKIQFALVSLGNGKYIPQVISRDTYNAAATVWLTNTTEYQFPNYVWLRIVRNQATGGFQFYHASGGNTPPGNWTPYASEELLINKASSYEPIEDEIQVGLFNDSQNTSVVQTAEYVYFKFSYRPCEPGQGDGDVIQTAAGPVPTNVPPGYQYCPSAILETGSSFEKGSTSMWGLGNNTFIKGGGAHPPGNYKLAALTKASDVNPYFYQKLTLENPPPVSNTAVVNFSIWHDVDDNGFAEKTDTFKVALVTTPPSGSYPDPQPDELLTEPVIVTDGQMDDQPVYTEPKWRQISLELQVKPGINLNTYTGNVYLLVYNNSNVPGCTQSNSCHSTSFYFDDISLEICRTQPRPTNQQLLDAGKQATHIQGKIIINTLSDGGIPIQQPGEGVKVWAYSEGGELYETTSIQGGEYNFYGLPASSKGTRYFIYAETSIDGGSSTIIVGNNTSTTLMLVNGTAEVLGINLVLVDVDRISNTN